VTFTQQRGDLLDRIRHLLDERRSGALLEVDGGITTETIGAAWAAGADTFVAGTAVFGTADPAAAVRALRSRCAVRV
jgi:ribulose-phosphate 3-epimerase